MEQSKEKGPSCGSEPRARAGTGGEQLSTTPIVPHNDGDRQEAEDVIREREAYWHCRDMHAYEMADFHAARYRELMTAQRQSEINARLLRLEQAQERARQELDALEARLSGLEVVCYGD